MKLSALKAVVHRFSIKDCAILLPIIVAIISYPLNAQVSLQTITAGSGPAGMAVNPITNKVYVLNSGSAGTAGLTVIYANTGSTVSVNTGSYPQAVAIDPVSNIVYIANHNSNNVTVVDGNLDSVITTITVGTAPDAIAVNPVTHEIYVANSGANTVSIITGSNNTVLTTFAVGKVPNAIAINPTTDYAFVTNSSGNSVSAIDYYNHVLYTVTVGTTPQAVAVNPNSNTIYVTNTGNSTVSVFNGVTHTVTPVTVGSGPQAIAVDPVTNNVYVVCPGSNSVYFINGSNVATQIANVGTHPNALAINSLTGIVYVSSRDTGAVIAIPEATNVPGTPVATGTYPVTVAVNPITNQIFVANQTGGTVSQLSGLQNVLTTIPVGTSPVAIAENPSAQTVYVVNSGAGTVTPVSETTNTAGSVLTVGTNPSTALFDSANSTLYVTNTGSSSVSAIVGTTVTSIGVGLNPGALALSTATNNVYVANAGNGTTPGTVSVLNGTSLSTTVNVGINPVAIGVNPVTNMVYVANKGSGTVSILYSPSNNTVRTVGVGTNPTSVAVNSATNMTYVACSGSSSISVLSGTASIGSIVTSVAPYVVAVDSTQNLLYVLSRPGSGNGTLYVYSGLPSGSTSVAASTLLVTLTVGINPATLLFNSAANQVYVVNTGSNTISVINTINYATSTLSTGTSPDALALSATGNVLYAVNNQGNSLTAISALQPVPLSTSILGMGDSYTVSTQPAFITSNTSPSFAVSVYSSYANTVPYASQTSTVSAPPSAVYYQIDSTTGTWAEATGDTSLQADPVIHYTANPAVFTITSGSLSVGTHTLYAFAAYGNEAGTGSSSVLTGTSSEVGNITPYTFTIVSSSSSSLAASSVSLASSSNPAAAGANVTYTATVTGSLSQPTGTITFTDGNTVLGVSTLSNGSANFTQVGLNVGLHGITASYSGNSIYQPGSHNILQTTTGLTTPPSVSISTTGVIQSVFDYNTMKCAPQDFPDEGTRAFRDSLGNVHLLSSHSVNRQMVGTTLDNVVQQCPIVYQNDSSSDPSQYDDLGWLEDVYTLDGNTVYGLVSLDYHPGRHNIPCPGDSTDTNCWYSTIIQALSTNGGATYTSPAPGQARFVAGTPVTFSTAFNSGNNNTNVVGALTPSNIIPMNGAYYMLLWVASNTMLTGGSVQAGGDCLLRTTNLADPTAWRAWDGTGFNIQFFDPYTTPNIANLTIAQKGCTTVNVPVSPARSLMALMNNGTIVGYITSMMSSAGVIASTSSDLIHWSAATTVLSSSNGFSSAPGSCTGSSPCTGYFYYYPSFMDSASTSINFNTLNVNGSTAYMYLTQDNGFPTNIRNLVRVPISVTQSTSPTVQGCTSH